MEFAMSQGQEAAIGAKAGSLARLAAAGLPVPPFVVLPDALRRAFLAAVAEPRDPAAIRAAAWPPACRDAVRQALVALDGAAAGEGGGDASPATPSTGGVVEIAGIAADAATAALPPPSPETSPASPLLLAVRSSMAGEDGARWSYAGQLDSFLDVPADVDAADSRLLAAIQACWASARGARAEAYRRWGAGAEAGEVAAKGGDPRQGDAGADPPDPADRGPEPAMGVILQRMVRARAAGVLFTVDPTGGGDRAGQALLSVAPGTGEALVQGAVEGETLRLERATGRALDPCGLLSAGEIADLWRAALEAERLGGGPQDIEFAFGEEGLALLQARPVTAGVSESLDAAAAAADPEAILWDNSNITESYAGVTAPLTLSLIRRAYAGVYRQFLQLMGVAHPDEDLLQNLLGFYHGQVYYQLDRWYEALALLPAFQQNRAFLEQMMGVRQAAAGPARGGRPAGRLALAAWLLRMVRLHLGAARMTAAFHRQVGAELAAVAAMDLAGLSPRRLQALFRRLETEVLGRWRAPILADFMTMIFFGLLRRLSERWLPDRPGIVGELMVGQGTMASLEPLRAIEALAALVRPDQGLGVLLRGPAEEAWRRLDREPAWAPFHAACQDYLDRYGDRCESELKLEVPNLRDHPAQLLRLVSAAAARPAPGGAPPVGPSDAEARVARLPRARRLLYRWVLGHSRRYVADREAQRLVRSRVFGQLRRLFGALGGHFAQAGRLSSPDDIFYLTVDEVFAEVTGTAIDLDLRGLVALRRAQYARFAAEAPPERFATLGPPYWSAPRELRPAAVAPERGSPSHGGRTLSPSPSHVGEGSRGERAGRSGRVAPAPASQAVVAIPAETSAPHHGPDPAGAPLLRGLGCCAGRVTGRVRVVERVEEALDLDGEILVAARTDPGWVFLFPAAAGLLVERGSPLSHSAIVARELGLPTIVNIPGLTERLRTGDRVILDGRSGEIWLLEGRAG